MSKALGKVSGTRPTPVSETSSFRPSPHRSVNALAIRRLQNVAQSTNTDARLTALQQLWQQCASHDAYVSSLAAQALVDLAIDQGKLPWHEVFQGLEDVLSAAQGPSLMNAIHAISRLLMSAAKDDTLNPEKKKVTADMFKGKNRRHPFIHLVLAKPGTESILLAQVESILEGHGLDLAEKHRGSYRIHALSALETFLDFSLLDRHERTRTLLAPALVHWIHRVLSLATEEEGDTSDPFVVHLLDYLTTLPLRFPLDRHSLGTTLFSVLQSLVDFYRLPSTQSSLDSVALKARIGTNILLSILACTCDMRRYGQPTLPWIQTLERLVRPRRAYTVPTLPMPLQWAAYSYLLMDSPTVAEQELIVGWMHRLAVGLPDPVPAVIANLSFFPLFQTMSESKSDNASKQCTEILQVLERSSRPQQQCLEDNTLQDMEIAGVNIQGTLGVIQAEVVHLLAIWESLSSLVATDEEAPLDRYSLGDDQILQSLALTAVMFHPDPQVRMDAIARQANDEHRRLVTLVLFLYLLRTDPSASVQRLLLQQAIPSLVTSKDEYVTAKVLRTILTLIQGQAAAAHGQHVAMTGMGQRSKYTHLSAMGVRILYLMWLRQPRVWKALRQIVYEWVEARTRLHKPPIRGDAAYDMEVSVLTTIRDICLKNAASHAEVLIPFLATLLKSVELHPNSIALIIESLNISVKANVVEPRAAWNVILCHVAEHAKRIEHTPLYRVLCEFYGIAGSRTEETQVYLEFKQVILEDYIRPLLDSKQPKVLGAALRALSSFTAVEIQSILPVESPTLYIRQLILEAPTTLVVDEHSLLINKLARHELANLRRSLFKDAAGGRSAAHSDGASASAAKQSIDRTRLITKAVAQNILQKWQQGAVLPGLRMGYALSNLFCSSVASSGMNLDSQDAIRVQQPYRDLMAQLKDIAYTDHLLVRLSAVEGWSTRLDSLWIPEDDSQTLVVLETLMPDLKQQLSGGHIPAHCANTILAMTGVVLSLYRMAHPTASVQASLLAQYLLDQYVYPQDAKGEMANSDEVQFAVLMSLAHVTPLAAVDERLVRTVIRVFMDRLDQDAQTTSNASSELSSWAVFAAGWGLCALLAGLLDSPTRTSDLTRLCLESMRTVVSTIESPQASFELTLGLMMGFSRLTMAVALEAGPAATTATADTSLPPSLSSSLNLQDFSEVQLVERTLALAHGSLDAFLSETQQALTPHALARFLGAPWLLAYSSRQHLTPLQVAATTAKLDQVLLAMTARRDLQTHLMHITVPYCHALQINLDTRSPSSAEITALTSRVHSLVNLIRITPTSAARHTSVLALAACLGVDWGKGPLGSSLASGESSSSSGGLFTFLATQSSLASVLYSALNTLMEQSGLASTSVTAADKDMTVASILTAEGIALDPSIRTETKTAAPTNRPGGQTLMSMDLKAGRLATLVLGRFAHLVQQLATQDVAKVVGSSNEPRDYSRLPHSSSWLRALWEGLWEPLQLGTVQRAQRQAGLATSLTCLLDTLRHLPLPLPAVNWFPLLNQLVALEPALLLPTVRFASRHAMTSTSLMEYLVLVTANFKTAGRASALTATAATDGSADGRTAIDQAAQEMLVGEEGLGRLLALAGLPWLDHGSVPKTTPPKRSKDRVAAELDRVRGLDTMAKRVHLPISRAYELVESVVRLLFPTATRNEKTSEAEMEDREVLQLLLLDTLQHRMPRPRPLLAAAAGGGGGGGTKLTTSDGASTGQGSSTSNPSDALVHDLRALLAQVFYQHSVVASGRVASSERVLRRLAHLSFLSVSHVEAMPPASPRGSTLAEAQQVFKEAIGLASLYRAGLLTAAQESRMMAVAQKTIGLVLVRQDQHGGSSSAGAAEEQQSHDENDSGTVQEMLEMALSTLLLAMREGSLAAKPGKGHLDHRVLWLQRLLDLLILMADATPKLMLGIRWLLSGATLLWWDRHTLALAVQQGSQDLGMLGSEVMTCSSSDNAKKDAEAELLEMMDEGDQDEDEAWWYDQDKVLEGDNDDDDEQLRMDRRLDDWHAAYLEHTWAVFQGSTEDLNSCHLAALLNRMVLVLPDVVLYQVGPPAASTTPLGLGADHPASQITKRLLQLAQEHAVQSRERLFFIRLLRRLEALVPDGSKWVLLASMA